MSIPCSLILAVVPFANRPGRWQVLLSYLPAIILLLVVLTAPVLLRKVPWHRLLGRLSWRLPTAILAIIIGAALAYFLPKDTPPPSPSSSASRPATAGQWTTFMANAQRTGQADTSPGPAAGKKLWSFRDALSRAPFAASAAVVDGRAYVGADNKYLYCLDANTGSLIWKFKAACDIFAAPVLANGRVYVGEGLHQDNAARLYCLDAATGNKLWDFPTTSHIEFSPTLLAGKLYFAAGGDGIYCLDAATGAKLWQYPKVHVDVCPAVTDQGVFFGSVYDSPSFYRLEVATGKLVWSRPAPHDVCGSPSSDGTRVYFGLGNGSFAMSHAKPAGSVACLSAADGAILWTTSHVKDTVLTCVALAGGLAYFGSRDGNVYCIAADSGQPRWSFTTQDAVVSSPAIATGKVYFGSNDGSVYCLNSLTGAKLWAYDTSQAAFNSEAQVMASPVLANGRVYVGSMNFFFFCLGEASPPAVNVQ